MIGRVWELANHENIFKKFGIGADSSTFGLPRFAMPHYEMGVFKTGLFKTGLFKTGKIKTGFAENLGHCSPPILIKIPKFLNNSKRSK